VDWVKLATRYYTDDKVRRLDDAAELMFVRGLARAGELGDGGIIPDSDVSLLARRRRCETLVRQLVDARLWSRVDGGYRINAWADWQSAADALSARRAADRERQRRRRASDPPHENPSRDNGHVSRDVTPAEEEEERDLGGSSVGVTYDARAQGPPRTCPKHPKGTNDPCMPCKRAREAFEAHAAEKRERIRLAAKCRVHRGELEHNCRVCASEELSPA